MPSCAHSPGKEGERSLGCLLPAVGQQQLSHGIVSGSGRSISARLPFLVKDRGIELRLEVMLVVVPNNGRNT